MLVLHKFPFPDDTRVECTSILFGVGLIGAHVVRYLRTEGYVLVADLPFSWGNSCTRKYELAALWGCLAKLFTPSCKANCAELIVLDVIWCAGAGGFGMNEAQADQEFKDFYDVVELSSNVSGFYKNVQVRFHLLSSAGGLFEGQRCVTLEAEPDPKRCYGHLKLRQEQVLSNRNDLFCYIYRLSSVFGVSGPGKRVGLIPSLLINGINFRISSIYGNPGTLRDYVSAKDVANFIVLTVLSRQSSPRIYHLAAGKPTSLSEVQRTVETVLNRKIYIKYIDHPSNNSAHITFFNKSMPSHWFPRGIRVCIRDMWNDVFSTQVRPPLSLNYGVAPATRDLPGFIGPLNS